MRLPVPPSPTLENFSAKAVLAVRFNTLVDQLELNQATIALMTGMTQPKVSQIRRQQLQNISLERLMHALVSLGQYVEITVRPACKGELPGIIVVN